jgi:hypothetical protein
MPDDIRKLRYICAQHHRRQLWDTGIYHNNLEYNSYDLKPLLDAYGPGCKLDISNDDSDLGEIIVFDPRTGADICVPVKSKFAAFAKGLSKLRFEKIIDSLPKHWRNSTTLEDFQRADLDLDDQIEALRKRGSKSPQKNVARVKGYGSQSQLDADPSLASAGQRPDKNKAHQQKPVGSAMPHIPSAKWTLEDLKSRRAGLSRGATSETESTK